MTLAVPPDVAAQLVGGVETADLDEALGQAERHGGVVGPGARRQPEGAAADQVREGVEGAGRAELHRGAQRVADGQADQRAADALGIDRAERHRAAAVRSARSSCVR